MTRRRFLAGMSACGVLARSRPAAAQQAVRFGYGSPGYTWAVPYVADELNAWQKYGLKMSPLTFGSGRIALESCLTGDIDVATVADTPFIFAALRGLKPIVFANFQRQSGDMLVVVRKDRGVVAETPGSLKGKKLATSVGTNGQYFLIKYLEFGGLQKNDVTVVNMQPADAIVATVRGDVDGFVWTLQALKTAELQAPGQVMAMSMKGIEKVFQAHELLITNEKVAASRPEIMTAAVKALLDAERFIQTDRSWARMVGARTKATPEQVLAETATIDFNMRFDKRFLDDLVLQSEWAIADGLAKRPAKDLRQLFLDLIDVRALREVAPQRVNFAG